MKKNIRGAAPFLVLAFVQIVYHMMMRESIGADAIFYFKTKLDEYSLVEFLNMRYQTWSSRLLIEGILVYLARNIVLWKVLDCVVWVILGITISFFAPVSDSKKRSWIAIGLVLIYPMLEISSAGWIATTLNYIWPLAFGMIVLLAISRLLQGKKVSLPLFLASVPAVVFAGNMEQMCAILFGSCVLTILYMILKKKHIKTWWQLVIWLILLVSELIFICKCPGNKVRAKETIGLYLPYYQKYNFWDKLNLGFLDTMKHLFLSGNLLMFIFCLFLMALVWMKSDKISYRLIGVLPCACFVTGTFFFDVLQKNFSAFAQILNENNIISGDNYLFGFSYIPLLLYAVLLYCIIASFAVLSSSWTEFFVYGMVFGLGLTSRIVMGFSASIFTSSDRTFSYFYFLMIILIIYMFYKNMGMICEHRKTVSTLRVMFGAIVIFSILNNIVVVSSKL